jgi:hypothetical protein
MAKLARFSTPARLPDPRPDAWSARVSRIFAGELDPGLPQFYDPMKKNTPPSAKLPMISWAAFPATLRAQGLPEVARWARADGDRHVQDEYCEWAVERNAARKITRITFTTEIPEYFEHLNDNAEDRLLDLYEQFVGRRVPLRDLRNPDGSYKRENRWNTSGLGRLVHLMQGANNLGAAVNLVARATVLRIKNGKLVTNRQELVRCARLGQPLRNSDPQIASAVNVAASQGNEITLADPLGLHLGRPLTAGMVAPDGADAAEFWTIERGDAEHTLRARFEVPPHKKYVVGDLEIGGRPIRFGGQVADRVQVWVKAVVVNRNHTPKPRPCGA